MEKEIICVSNFNEGTDQGMKLVKVYTTGDDFKKAGEKVGRFICREASSAFVESLMKTICKKMRYSCKKREV